jgi:hypothetical protein
VTGPRLTAREQRHRRAAAALIRFMDMRDAAGAEAAAARLGPDTDAVTAWVWRLEAERAAVRRAWRASPAWRLERRPAGALRVAAEPRELLAGLVGVLSRDVEANGWLPRPEASRAAWREDGRRRRARQRAAGEGRSDAA